LVQHIQVTDDAERAARQYLDAVAEVIPDELIPTVNDVLESPYCLIGTVDEIVTKIQRLRDRWGFTRYTVRTLEPLINVIGSPN
jgi:alkanesulfonate monooxygenase SsuD/methylene tetrahydromethanopterin reductase-like flavin-dependent oxidoreductase (luciferase family)